MNRCKILKFKMLTVVLFSISTLLAQERVEYLPYGKMDSWTVRYIKESVLLGGKTRALYVIAKTDTIRQNKPYPYGKNGSPWGTSILQISSGCQEPYTGCTGNVVWVDNIRLVYWRCPDDIFLADRTRLNYPLSPILCSCLYSFNYLANKWMPAKYAQLVKWTHGV